MSAAGARGSAVAVAMVLLAIGVAGCAADGGYGYDTGVGLDYYEPYGGTYGGWGPGYHVGPFRDGSHFPRGGGRPGGHAFRSAPASHAMPSIPSHARGGGHGGGGHGGGGHR